MALFVCTLFLMAVPAWLAGRLGRALSALSRSLRAREPTLEQRLRRAEDEVGRRSLTIRSMQEGWKILPRDLVLAKYVGEGGEGRVYRGQWQPVNFSQNTCFRLERTALHS